MKYKIFLLTVILSAGSFAFAQSRMVERSSFSRPSAIQSTNMVFKNAHSTYYATEETMLAAIKELQQRINASPDDYSLYVNLIDLYVRTKQYDNAYEELAFLSNLSKRNKLNSQVKGEVYSLISKYKSNTRYDIRNKYQLYIVLSLMNLIINESENAENYLLLASEIGINDNMLKDAITIVFDYENNPQKAISVCNAILQRNPDDMQIRKLKALYLVQLRNFDEAITEYETILAVNGSDRESKYNLYKLLSAKNYSDKEIIKKMYSKNIAESEEVYSELADILMKNKDFDGAKKYAEILVNKYPKNSTGHMILAELYQKEGNLKASYEALSKLRDTADSNEAVAKYNVMLAKLSDEPVREANSLMANGLYRQALDVLESANQENLYVILTQVRANYMLSNKQTAMDLLNRAMSLYPENSDVYCAFGYIYLQEKDIEIARKYTDASLKINPKNKTAKDLLDMVNKAEADTYMQKIIYSYERQNYSDAMQLIDEAIKINDKDSGLYFYKALTYIAQNNYASSTASLYKSIELDRNYAPAYFYLGLAFDNLSEPQNALNYYKQYINLLKDDDYYETERKEYAVSRINQLNNH